MGLDMYLYKVKKTQSKLAPSAKDIVLVDEYLKHKKCPLKQTL